MLYRLSIPSVPTLVIDRWGDVESLEEARKRDPDYTFLYETPFGAEPKVRLRGGVVYRAGVRSVNAAGASEEVFVEASPCVDCAPPPPPPTTTTAVPVVEEVSDGGFTSVTAGWGYSCGLRLDRSVECWEWRADLFGHPERMMGSRLSIDSEIFWSSDPSDGAPPGGEFALVDAGWGYACALRPAGGVECWGWNPVAALEPPAGEFTSVSAGLEHACGLRPGGEAECWGVSSRREGGGVSPDGPFASVVAGALAGSGFLCGLRPGGEVECWGRGYGEGEASPPSGEFKLISGGDGSNVCGLRLDSSVECWSPYLLQDSADKEVWGVSYVKPGGVFESISPGSVGYACGLRPSGEVECWGRTGGGRALPAPEGKFTWVVAKGLLACGLPADGGVVCWNVQTGENLSRVREGEFKSLSISGSHMCALRVDGQAECWSMREEDFGAASPPGGRFESVSVNNGKYSCGLRPSGEVECWGSNQWRKSTPPGGVFTQITTSRNFACGLRPSGEIQCWGAYGFLRWQTKVVPPRERLVSVDAGWGGWDNSDSPTSSVRSGGRMDWGSSCGLRADGTPLCWGDYNSTSRSLVLHPPKGEFLNVRMGQRRACGLRPDGSMECWGRILVADEDAGWTYEDAPVVYTDPSGEGFVDVQLDAWHACGLRPAGGVHCWNWWWEARGREYSLEGPYVSISAGFSHSCGLRRDGGVDCWGLTGEIQRLPEAES